MSRSRRGRVHLFHETLHPRPSLRWVLRGFAVALSGVVLFGVATVELARWEQVLGLSVGLGVAVLVLAVHGAVDVSPTQVRLSLRPFWRRSLPIRELVSVSRVRVAPLAQSGALGLRYLGHREWLLALRKGEGIRLEMSDGTVYTVGLDRVAAFERAVHEARGGS